MLIRKVISDLTYAFPPHSHAGCMVCIQNLLIFIWVLFRRLLWTSTDPRQLVNLASTLGEWDFNQVTIVTQKVLKKPIKGFLLYRQWSSCLFSTVVYEQLHHHLQFVWIYIIALSSSPISLGAWNDLVWILDTDVDSLPYSEWCVLFPSICSSSLFPKGTR